MTARYRCLIPGCRRTRPCADFAEWICAKHWPLVPRQMRRAYASAMRRRKPASAINRIWRRCREEAIAQALTSGFG